MKISKVYYFEIYIVKNGVEASMELNGKSEEHPTFGKLTTTG